MVEGIERLQAELGSHVFAELPVLFQRRIPILIARSSQVGEEARSIAPGVAAIGAEFGVSKGAGVEPLIDGRVVDVDIRDDVRSWIAAEGGDIASGDADGNAGLEGCDAR